MKGPFRKFPSPVGVPIVGQRKSPTVALGYCYGTLHGPFVDSLLALREWDLKRMAEGRDPLVRQRLPRAGIYIDHNRNRIAEQFFAGDCDWLLQIDTDIAFPPDIVETLLRLAGSDKKILAASVPLEPPMGSSAFMLTEMPGIWKAAPSEFVTADGVVADGVATAMILIHREVFDSIAAKFGQCWYLKDRNAPCLHEEASRAAWLEDGPIRDRKYVPQGEDLAFCLRAAEVGMKSWCVKVPGLRHHKALPMSHDFETPGPVAMEGA